MRRLAVVLSAVVASCVSTAPRTQVMVRIEADPGIVRDARHLHVIVRAGPNRSTDMFAVRSERDYPDVGAPGFPVEIGLVPADGDIGRVFEVTALAQDDGSPRPTLATARVISGYVAGQTLLVTLRLEDACRGIMCGATQTCRSGDCFDAFVEPTLLAPYGIDAGPSEVDAHPAEDASRDASRLMDAPTDAHIEVPVDTGVDVGAPADAGPDAAGGDDAGPSDPLSRACWRALPDAGAPVAVTTYPPTAIWTESIVVVWGGSDPLAGASVRTGGRLTVEPLGSWAATSTTLAPPARHAVRGAWSGSEVLIFGGFSRPGGFRGDFWAYNPGTDEWRAPPTTGAPGARSYACHAWTGDDLVVWGGGNGSIGVNTGARWNETDGWRATTTVGAPPGRQPTGACLWTGTELIVWGGDGLRSGGVYGPGGDSWRSIELDGAPPGGSRGAYGIIGEEMIVWGGHNETDWLPPDSGGAWNIRTGTWRAITAEGEPTPRSEAASVAVGGLLIVWGGLNASGVLGDGAAYDPVSDRWYPLPTVGAPPARSSMFFVAIPQGMFVWGGSAGSLALASGAILDLDCGAP